MCERCPVCFRHCSLKEGAAGFCGARSLVNGQIVPNNYGKLTALALDPIEKKPLARFHPGSLILSAGSYGCNLRCPFCQNSDISWSEEALKLAEKELDQNSMNFNRGFYRSIIPTVVAAGVGQLLLLMLLFFIIVYYVTPLYKILSSLKSYQEVGKKYSYNFDGDDQMAELNRRIAELASENQQLRRRIAVFRAKFKLSGKEE